MHKRPINLFKQRQALFPKQKFTVNRALSSIVKAPEHPAEKIKTTIPRPETPTKPERPAQPEKPLCPVKTPKKIN